ncbi:MAG: hypothetical protein ACT4OX_14560 [Actinomycetota bacterium]
MLDVVPATAVAVEDSPNGIRAPKAAGLNVVVVPNEITKQLDLGEADLVLGSLADCSLVDAIAQL